MTKDKENEGSSQAVHISGVFDLNGKRQKGGAH